MAISMQSQLDESKQLWNLRVKGEVDIYTAADFKDQLSQLTAKDPMQDIHIDASELEYIDSTGIGILIGALKKLKKDGKDIYIENAKPNILKIFNITGLDRVFKMEGQRDKN